MAPGLKTLLANPLHLQLLPKQRQMLYFGFHWQAGTWSFDWLHQERAKGELLRFSLTVLSQMAFGRQSWGKSQVIHNLSFQMCLNQLQQGQGTKSHFSGRAWMSTADLLKLSSGRLGNLTIFCQMFFIHNMLWFIFLAWLPYITALQTLYFLPGSAFLFLVLQLLS